MVAGRNVVEPESTHDFHGLKFSNYLSSANSPITQSSVSDIGALSPLKVGQLLGSEY